MEVSICTLQFSVTGKLTGQAVAERTLNVVSDSIEKAIPAALISINAEIKQDRTRASDEYKEFQKRMKSDGYQPVPEDQQIAELNRFYEAHGEFVMKLRSAQMSSFSFDVADKKYWQDLAKEASAILR
jgi:hypothetical protein